MRALCQQMAALHFPLVRSTRKYKRERTQAPHNPLQPVRIASHLLYQCVTGVNTSELLIYIALRDQTPASERQDERSDGKETRETPRG